MFSVDLQNSRLHLRPLEWRDADALAEVIFGDPEVAKTLAHDASSEQSQRACAEGWCKRLAIDSAQSKWAEMKLGAWVLVETATSRSAERLIGIRGFMADKKLPDRCVGSFIALARSHWRRGLASEMTPILLDYVFQQTDTQAVFTEVWPLLNPRSEAVQAKMGYEPIGRHSVREAHGEDRMHQIAAFELWRASNAAGALRYSVLREVGIKMGQLAAEKLHSTEDAVELVLTQTSSPDQATRELVRDNVQLGFENPAWLTYRLDRSAWLDRRGKR
jgi:RimJ/RimL family protein N-acetyltransferase